MVVPSSTGSGGRRAGSDPGFVSRAITGGTAGQVRVRRPDPLLKKVVPFHWRYLVSEIPDLLTVSEAARILRISRTTAYRLVRLYLATGGREGIPAVRVGGQLRVPRVELEKLIGGPVRWPPAADAATVIDLDGRRATTARRRTPSSPRPATEADQLRFPLA
jgi:excisionase family DNA binding protein